MSTLPVHGSIPTGVTAEAGAACPLPALFSGRGYIRRLLFAAIADAARKYVAPLKRPTVVDLGCGEGPYRGLLAHAGGRYVGVDLPGNLRADIIAPDACRTGLEDGTADVLLSTQVLEHVADPSAYLAECRRVLAPCGLLILSTHGTWKYHAHPTDFWRWTCDGLRRTVQNAGFQVIEQRGLMGLAPTGGQLLQDAIVSSLPRPVRGIVAGAWQPLLWALDRLHTQAQRDQDACVYLVVARAGDTPAQIPQPQQAARGIS